MQQRIKSIVDGLQETLSDLIKTEQINTQPVLLDYAEILHQKLYHYCYDIPQQLIDQTKQLFPESLKDDYMTNLQLYRVQAVMAACEALSIFVLMYKDGIKCNRVEEYNLIVQAGYSIRGGNEYTMTEAYYCLRDLLPKVKKTCKEYASIYTLWGYIASENCGVDQDGNTDSIRPIVDEAIANLLKKKTATDETDQISRLSVTSKSVTSKKADKLLFPLDTINTKIWQSLDLESAKVYPIKAEKDGSKKKLTILYSIDFDELGNDISINKTLTSFDKRVYIAAASLYDAGNEYTTITQIYYAMGYTSKPSEDRIAQINKSLTKMSGTRITVDNTEQAQSYNYPRFIYNGLLLPFESITSVSFNGKPAEVAIHFFRRPPLISFAQQRKQLTTIDPKLLQSPISKTEANIALDNYLIERIARAKSKHQQRILYETLYQRTGIETSKQKQRTPDKVKTLLEHYKKNDFIAGYSMQTDGITVYFQKPKKQEEN